MVSQSELYDVPPWLPEHFIGGHAALDFVNTVSHRSNPELAVDRFNRLDKIAGWCACTGVLDDVVARRLSHVLKDKEAGLVRRLEALRCDAGAVFDAVAEERTIPSRALAQIMMIAGRTMPELDLKPNADKLVVPHPAQTVSADALIGLIAMQLLDGFYRLPHDRIRSCSGCRWLFVDRSRPGRRKWCSMKDCGNRAKVHRHYRKRKLKRQNDG